MSVITVSFPSELLVATKESQEEFRWQVRFYALAHLYEQGKISSGFAAQILGSDKWEFYRQLSEHGFNVIDYDPEDAALEAETSHALADQIASR